MSKKGQEGSVQLLFFGIAIAGFFSFVTIFLLTSIENQRYDNAVADWKNEATMLVKRIINSKNCLAYEEKIIYFDSINDDLLSYVKTFAGTVDMRKLTDDRLNTCLLYNTEATVCDDCPKAMKIDNRCPKEYCKGDFYQVKYHGKCDDNGQWTRKVCNTGGGVFSFLTRGLTLAGLLPCFTPGYDAVPCSPDDDGDSFIDESITEEHKLYLSIELYDTGKSQPVLIFKETYNPLHYNARTFSSFDLPVKIYYDNSNTAVGLLKIGLAVDIIYFNARVV